MNRKRSLNIYQFLIKAFKNLKAYLFSTFFWVKPRQQFFIFAEGRSGSTLLVELLNQHKSIHCEEEIFNKFSFIFRLKVPFPYAYLKGLERFYPGKVFSFKVKISQLKNHQKIDPKIFIDRLHRRGYQIIHLYRRDHIAQEVSSLLAWHNNKYHVYYNEKFSFKAFRIDPIYFKKQLELRKEYLKEELEILQNIPHLRICYENDLLKEEKQQLTIDKICNFIGLNTCKVESKMIKSNVFEYEDIIENYLEISPIIHDVTKKK